MEDSRQSSCSSKEIERPSPSNPPPRSNPREFFKHIKSTPVSPEACVEILRLYDFEKTYTEQSPAVLCRVEELLGYDGYPWINDNDRAHWICYKATRILRRYLWYYGFVFSFPVSSTVFTNLCRYNCFTNTLVDGEPRMIISPLEEGFTPSPLPEWLSTPYLIRVPFQDFSYKPG